MKVTIIHDTDSDVAVHRAECADIKRRELRKRSNLSHWDVEVKSQMEAAYDAWSDFIAEGSMTEAQAFSYCTFYPCLGDLPERWSDADKELRPSRDEAPNQDAMGLSSYPDGPEAPGRDYEIRKAEAEIAEGWIDPAGKKWDVELTRTPKTIGEVEELHQRYGRKEI